jgi:ribosome-associated protein
MPKLTIHGDHITLAHALKEAGLAGSGGQAKHLVREGTVQVNGSAETRPGRKLIAGDRFRVGDGEEWLVERADGGTTSVG